MIVALAPRLLDRRTAAEVIDLEARIQRTESVECLTSIRDTAERANRFLRAGYPMQAHHEMASVVSLAERRLRQLGGDAA